MEMRGLITLLLLSLALDLADQGFDIDFFPFMILFGVDTCKVDVLPNGHHWRYAAGSQHLFFGYTPANGPAESWRVSGRLFRSAI